MIRHQLDVFHDRLWLLEYFVIEALEQVMVALPLLMKPYFIGVMNVPTAKWQGFFQNLEFKKLVEDLFH